ncbi:hypothetical protein [Sphingomonas faeni]|uniref:hypothetical protein n=1 Tax=Sphingomonas faeni TaxID=185950 RepID=UPI003364E6E7
MSDTRSRSPQFERMNDVNRSHFVDEGGKQIIKTKDNKSEMAGQKTRLHGTTSQFVRDKAVGAIPQNWGTHFCFGGACARGGLRPLWRRRLQVL